MTDNSHFWREIDPSTQNYSLTKEIKKKEAEIKKNAEMQEEYLQHLFDMENWEILSKMDIGSMTWEQVNLYNDIRKRYENVGKDFSGNPLDEFPQSAGSVPDTAPIYEKLMGNLIEMKKLIDSKGYQVPHLLPMSSLTDIRDNVFTIRDALKGQVQPESPTEIEEEPDPNQVHKSSGYTRRELIATQKEISKMLKELEEL